MASVASFGQTWVALSLTAASLLFATAHLLMLSDRLTVYICQSRESMQRSAAPTFTRLIRR